MTTVLLDPTAELEPAGRPAASGLTSLDGPLALVDISKPRGSVFLDRLQQLLENRGVAVERYRKATHARVAPPDLRRRIVQRCRAAVVALAD